MDNKKTKQITENALKGRARKGLKILKEQKTFIKEVLGGELFGVNIPIESTYMCSDPDAFVSDNLSSNLGSIDVEGAFISAANDFAEITYLNGGFCADPSYDPIPEQEGCYYVNGGEGQLQAGQTSVPGSGNILPAYPGCSNTEDVTITNFVNWLIWLQDGSASEQCGTDQSVINSYFEDSYIFNPGIGCFGPNTPNMPQYANNPEAIAACIDPSNPGLTTSFSFLDPENLGAFQQPLGGYFNTLIEAEFGCCSENQQVTEGDDSDGFCYQHGCPDNGQLVNSPHPGYAATNYNPQAHGNTMVDGQIYSQLPGITDTDLNEVCEYDFIIGCTHGPDGILEYLAPGYTGGEDAYFGDWYGNATLNPAVIHTNGLDVSNWSEMGSETVGASNYDVNATHHEQSSCVYKGCTDSDTFGGPFVYASEAIGSPDRYGNGNYRAINYDPLATEDDGSCIYDTDGDGINDEDAIFGCMDPEADNYNPTANVAATWAPTGAIIVNPDDGTFSIDQTIDISAGDLNFTPYSTTIDDVTNQTPLLFVGTNGCIYFGCTDPTASNFDENANLDDASCYYNPGCTVEEAFNYDPDADFDDGSCEDVIYGCTDPDANNYDEAANTNNADSPCEVTGCPLSTAFNPSEFLFLDNGGQNPDTDIYYTVVDTDPTSCIDVLTGCTDPEAFNYNESANTDDGSCEAVVEGCMNATMFNFNPDANIDDGSCTPIIEGCMDPDAVNYNDGVTELEYGNTYTVTVNTDDGSCYYNPGCTIEGSLNYDSTADFNDGSCITQVLGCTDNTAINYNSEANVDDGLCWGGPTNLVGVCLVDGATNYYCDNYTTLNLYPGYPNAGAGLLPNGNALMPCNASGELPSLYFNMIVGDEEACEDLSYGCTDEGACNTDADANVDDGTCEYESCTDCMDETACNYNPDATIAGDEESYCDYTSCAGCMNEEACNYSDLWTISYEVACIFPEDDAPCAGCLDETACNYMPNAFENDQNECEYTSCAGCMDDGGAEAGGVYANPGVPGYAACNYDSEAIIDNIDLCEYETCAGCMDQNSSDYDDWATIPQTCALEQYAVCLEETASNYLQDADGNIYDIESDGIDYTLVATNNICNMWGCYPPLNALGDDFLYAHPDDIGLIATGTVQQWNNNTIITGIVEGDDGCPVYDDTTGEWGNAGFLNLDCCIFPGCTDTSACNYQANATEDDGSCYNAQPGYDCDGNCLDEDEDGVCNFDEIGGCMDPNNSEYNPNATEDDGSCDDGYTIVYGCTDQAACNTYFAATDDDGSCTYPSYQCPNNGPVVCNASDCPSPSVYGCTVSTACNYNSNATANDGSCQYANGCDFCYNYQGLTPDDPGFDNATVPTNGTGYVVNGDEDSDGICDYYEIDGCTDESACNYNSFATEDDGSCEYPPQGLDCQGNPTEYSIDYPYQCWDITAIQCDPEIPEEYQEEVTFPCSRIGTEVWPLGYNVDFTTMGFLAPAQDILGCTDEEADNYNPDATEDDGTCDYGFMCAYCAPTTVRYYYGVWPFDPSNPLNSYNGFPWPPPASTGLADGGTENFDGFWFPTGNPGDYPQGSVTLIGSELGEMTTQNCNSMVDWTDDYHVQTVQEMHDFCTQSPQYPDEIPMSSYTIYVSLGNEVPETPGCTDENAQNYNSSATEDDGSCYYFPCEEACQGFNNNSWFYSYNCNSYSNCVSLCTNNYAEFTNNGCCDTGYESDAWDCPLSQEELCADFPTSYTITLGENAFQPYTDNLQVIYGETIYNQYSETFTYDWSLNGASIPDSYLPQQQVPLIMVPDGSVTGENNSFGTYQVTVTDNNGCTVTSNQLTYGGSQGIDPINQDDLVSDDPDECVDYLSGVPVPHLASMCNPVCPNFNCQNCFDIHITGNQSSGYELLYPNFFNEFDNPYEDGGSCGPYEFYDNTTGSPEQEQDMAPGSK